MNQSQTRRHDTPMTPKLQPEKTLIHILFICLSESVFERVYTAMYLS